MILQELPYISRIYTAYRGEDSSILGTNEMFGDRTSQEMVGKWIYPGKKQHLDRWWKNFYQAQATDFENAAVAWRKQAKCGGVGLWNFKAGFRVHPLIYIYIFFNYIYNLYSNYFISLKWSQRWGIE